MSVRLEGLEAGYGKIRVLHDISVEAGAGRICALIGHNGSGKTTLMRCINGIIKPSRGKVIVAGVDISGLGRDRIARLVSLVPQGGQAPFRFTSVEMILMGGATRVRPWAAPSTHERHQALEVSREVGISDLENIPFNQLSGGQQQLVMLARALHQNSPVMLLDEPNSHLDFSNQHRMMVLMRKVVKERGATALISLHDPNLALHYADDVVMLGMGKVIAAGPAGEFLDDLHLRAAIGENLMLDRTVTGRRVVVPRNVPGNN